MKLSDIWKEEEAYTKAASDLARQLDFAGIAIIWLFKVEEHGSIHLDMPLLQIALLFVCSLAFDLFQFIAGIAVYRTIGNKREKLAKSAQDGDYPAWVLWPIDVFFWLKLAAVICGYAFLLRYLLSKLV
ncbi:MAG TPA: hypothetical protein VMU01_08715 [Rhizomicrobium sp.]|nr:hypothetical protein [Rhizomicrobium sp.]